MRACVLDSETCGLHGMPVLLQFAFDDGPVQLWDIWKKPVHQTLSLIEEISQCLVVGFNLSFDWFQINKLFTIWSLCDPTWIPEQHILEIAELEPLGRDQLVVKPAGALDLMLHSRRGPYQALMARSDIRIRKVPTVLAEGVARELEERIVIDGIYFARSSNPDAPKWTVENRKDDRGEYDPHLKDVVLRFKPAGGLKFLTEHALGIKPKYKDFKEVEPATRPYELGFAPFASAVSSAEKNWEVWGWDKDAGKQKLLGRAWPAIIADHIEHWATNERAREYATDDVVYTRMLRDHFGRPEPNDDDSVLACMVAVVRWRGFQIDKTGIADLRDKALDSVAKAPCNIGSPKQVKDYLLSMMNAEESAVTIIDSTSKKKLTTIVDTWDVKVDEECGKCTGDPSCKRCGGSGQLKAGDLHPVAKAAKLILGIRTALKEVELYDKLLKAGRFHASFKVIGTLSSRMSGADGLNPQGIKKTKEVRSKFPLAWDGFVLCGGDFDSFEVTLADAVYQDPALRTSLTTKVPCHKCSATGRAPCKPCKGKGCLACETLGLVECEDCDGSGKTTKKIHALFAMELYPGKTYEDVVASDGTEDDMYTKGKQGVFAMIYGGNYATLMKNLSIMEEVAKRADEGFTKRFPGIGKSRQRIEDAFCSMKQPYGIGSRVVWSDPEECVESFLGFRRYFTLENMIVKALYDMANRPPTWWRAVDVKVVRSQSRIQTAGGAAASALYAAAFGLQAANMRAAANHEIQSPGGEITKRVQRRIWDLQPAGVGELVVAPMNIHDEIQCVTHPDYVEAVGEAIRDTVEGYREKVPLIGMTWFKRLENWADKKAGSDKMKVCAKEMALAV